MSIPYSSEVDIQLLRILAHSQDPKLLTVIDLKKLPDGFTKDVISTWKNTNKMDYVTTAMLLKSPAMQGERLRSIYDEKPYDYINFESLVQNINTRYSQRMIKEKLEQVMKKISNTKPEELELELVQFFQEGDFYEKKQSRKITDGYTEDDSEIVLTIGGAGRTGIDNLIPLRGSVITIGADSGHHKTNQAIDICLRFLDNNPTKKVVFLSMEMTFKEIQARVFANRLGLNVRSILTKKPIVGSTLTPEQIQDAIFKDHPHIVENFTVLDLSEVKNATDISNAFLNHKPDVWALDFIQWASMQGNDPEAQNANVMGMVAFSKAAATINNSFGVLLSQIKKIDSRLTQFPRLNDLEWSGLLKQISHAIGMCFWPHKIRQSALRDWYAVSWQKSRNSDMFTETAQVNPELCRFTYPYPLPGSLQMRNEIKSYFSM
jgi:replicative DNA helicase